MEVFVGVYVRSGSVEFIYIHIGCFSQLVVLEFLRSSLLTSDSIDPRLLAPDFVDTCYL